ncbi:MAG: hypothetical protein HFJ50_10245, partial [Clostridia bacterium]|nr:hypothetical protein [Clostridia bacterium]
MPLFFYSKSMKNTYKYDYRLQNGTWTTAKYSNGNFTGLSDGKTYELRVTVTDRRRENQLRHHNCYNKSSKYSA